jgi:hypothetical protein
MEVKLLFIVDFSSRWGWMVSVMCRPLFIPGERIPGTHWIGSWVSLGSRPDDGGSMHLWNVGLLWQDYTAIYLRRLNF